MLNIHCMHCQCVVCHLVSLNQQVLYSASHERVENCGSPLREVFGTGDKEDVVQELWLVCANAGLGAARDLAVDRRYAALQLEPTAAVAVRYDNIKNPQVLPAGGGAHPRPTNHLKNNRSSRTSCFVRQT